MDTPPSPYDAPHSKLCTVCAKSLINILNNNGDKMQPYFNPIIVLLYFSIIVILSHYRFSDHL